MSRFQYQRPPVHEVILSLGFHEKLDAEELERLPDVIGSRFARSDRLEQMQAEVIVGPAGETGVTSGRRRFEGWLFKSEDGSQILRTTESQVSYHTVRPGKWPAGPYPGWSVISTEWFRLVDALAVSYEPSPIRRAGLRYLNRIAISEHADLGRWFTLMLQAPGFLRDPFAFNLAQTWARTQDNERLSANVKMAKIKIEDPQYAKGNQGVLLDIEVFNLYVKNAPRYEEFREWFEQAHAVENSIFEECITEQLREQFEKVREEA